MSSTHIILIQPPRSMRGDMAKKRRGKTKIDVSSEAAQGFRGGLSGAFALAGFELSPSDQAQETSSSTPDQTHAEPSSGLLDPLDLKRPLVLNLSKKGRGGKVVTTLLVKSEQDERALQALTRELGKSLGCRAWVEERLICLQGDQRERVGPWVDQMKRRT